MTRHRLFHLLILVPLALACLLAAAGAAPCQTTPAVDTDSTTRGRLATLHELTPPSQDRLLLARIQLFGQAMEQALDSIQHNQLQEFTRKWAHAVDMYSQLGDQISQASESMGRAEVGLERAAQQLQAAGRGQQVAPDVQQQVSSDVDALRAQVLARLTALRAAHQQADEQQRQVLLPRMQALLQQSRQLDDIQQGLQSTTAQGSFAVAAARIEGKIDQAMMMLQHEQEILLVASQSVHVAMQSAQSQINHVIRLADVQSQIPNAELQQVGRARTQVQSALSQVVQARRQAEQLIDRLLGAAQADDIDQPALLAEIDALLSK